MIEVRLIMQRTVIHMIRDLTSEVWELWIKSETDFIFLENIVVPQTMTAILIYSYKTKVPVTFCNLRGYDGHLIMSAQGKTEAILVI